MRVLRKIEIHSLSLSLVWHRQTLYISPPHEKLILLICFSLWLTTMSSLVSINFSHKITRKASRNNLAEQYQISLLVIEVKFRYMDSLAYPLKIVMCHQLWLCTLRGTNLSLLACIVFVNHDWLGSLVEMRAFILILFTIDRTFFLIFSN